MPHVSFVPLSGLRVREEELLEFGMSLPGLPRRASALAELPSLGLLTLAGMTPAEWTCSYHDAAEVDEALVERVAAERPALVAISALTASVLEAYRLSDALRARGLRVVLGGLHATCESVEARQHCDAVVVGEGEPLWPQILQDAQRKAYRILDDAEGASVTRRDGADHYAREVLFNLEEQLADILGQVRRGIDALKLEVEASKKQRQQASQMSPVEQIPA